MTPKNLLQYHEIKFTFDSKPADALGYTTPTNFDPGHTVTFDSLVLPEQLNGKPVSFRLSFDWS